MKPCYFPAFLMVAVACLAAAGDKPQSPVAPRLTKQTRIDIIRTFTTELVYIRTAFPMGKTGLQLKNGTLSPSGAELQQKIAMWGPAVKPGDMARITNIVIKDDHIRFEINGGPVRKQKWYQHIQIGVGNATTPVGPNDSNTNPRGSYVDLAFERYVPELNPQQLKDLLRPVFDFNSKSALEAYLDTVPPKVKTAIQNHQVLVGMNREMVIYSKGRAPTKTREKEGDVEWEEWIYGQPPQDVDFVRFVGDEVVRVETMKVDGQKIVRTEKEVDLEGATSVAKGPSETERPANAPSLRRPGEEMPTPTQGPSTPHRPPQSPDTFPPDPSDPSAHPVPNQLLPD